MCLHETHNCDSSVISGTLLTQWAAAQLAMLTSSVVSGAVVLMLLSPRHFTNSVG